jgi:hypothetical protein
MPEKSRPNRAEQKAARALAAARGIGYTHALALLRSGAAEPDPAGSPAPAEPAPRTGPRVGTVTLSEIAANNMRMDAGFYLAPVPVRCPGHADAPCEDNPADPCRNCYDARRAQG